MPVSFLDIVPISSTATVTLETESGPVALELTGLRLQTLGELAIRYPAFARVIEGGPGSIIQASDALPAVVAAGLGHPGDAQYEAKAASFATAQIMAMAVTVVRLTFPQTKAAAPDPLAEPRVANGADGDAIAILRPA